MWRLVLRWTKYFKERVLLNDCGPILLTEDREWNSNIIRNALKLRDVDLKRLDGVVDLEQGFIPLIYNWVSHVGALEVSVNGGVEFE